MQAKVGDVVAWDKVPIGTLVRDEDGADIGTMALRENDSSGRIVWHVSAGRWKRAGRWSPWDSWWPGRAQHVTIIAMDLTGQESAAELQRLAEMRPVGGRLPPRRQSKVGDVVAWKHVRDGMLVRSHDSAYALRMRGRGVFVGMPGEPWLPAHPWDDAGKWRWGSTERPGSTATPNDQCTIIALDVPADATADDLRELAEVFEVREALYVEAETCSYANVRIASHGVDVFVLHGTDTQAAAERLHAAGWRPGMTAEDAARMLAEVRDGEA